MKTEENTTEKKTNVTLNYNVKKLIVFIQLGAYWKILNQEENVRYSSCVDIIAWMRVLCGVE